MCSKCYPSCNEVQWHQTLTVTPLSSQRILGSNLLESVLGGDLDPIESCGGPTAVGRAAACELTYNEMNTWIKLLKRANKDPLVYDYARFERALQVYRHYRLDYPWIFANLTYYRTHYPAEAARLAELCDAGKREVAMLEGQNNNASASLIAQTKATNDDICEKAIAFKKAAAATQKLLDAEFVLLKRGYKCDTCIHQVLSVCRS